MKPVTAKQDFAFIFSRAAIGTPTIGTPSGKPRGPVGRILTGMTLTARAPVLCFIRFYRLALSPLFANTCRFYPTCSAYGLEAIRQHGVMKGGVLTARRLLKCHPWHCSHHFTDPVPERFAWRDLFSYNRIEKDEV